MLLRFRIVEVGIYIWMSHAWPDNPQHSKDFLEDIFMLPGNPHRGQM